MDATAIIVGIVGGGGLFAFIQYLITRHDRKKGLMKAIKNISDEIDALRKEMHEDRATNARIRILSFSDEIRHNVRHSKESFDQINSDIDIYRRYCDEHPDYKNNRAVLAISNIERVYSDCLRKQDFLE